MKRYLKCCLKAMIHFLFAIGGFTIAMAILKWAYYLLGVGVIILAGFLALSAFGGFILWYLED